MEPITRSSPQPLPAASLKRHCAGPAFSTAHTCGCICTDAACPVRAAGRGDVDASQFERNVRPPEMPVTLVPTPPRYFALPRDLVAGGRLTSTYFTQLRIRTLPLFQTNYAAGLPKCERLGRRCAYLPAARFRQQTVYRNPILLLFCFALQVGRGYNNRYETHAFSAAGVRVDIRSGIGKGRRSNSAASRQRRPRNW